jgi:hypothetical protein
MVWFGQMLHVPAWNPATRGTIPGIEAAIPAVSLDNLSSPNRPDSDNLASTPIEDRDDDQATDKGKLSNAIRQPLLSIAEIQSDPLPPSPNIADDAYRISPVYRVTQRIRL